MPNKTICTMTLVHAAAIMPYLGIRNKFKTKLIIKERPTVITRYLCLSDMVKIFPNIYFMLSNIQAGEKKLPSEKEEGEFWSEFLR